jgi:hypothetical protein
VHHCASGPLYLEHCSGGRQRTHECMAGCKARWLGCWLVCAPGNGGALLATVVVAITPSASRPMRAEHLACHALATYEAVASTAAGCWASHARAAAGWTLAAFAVAEDEGWEFSISFWWC